MGNMGLRHGSGLGLQRLVDMARARDGECMSNSYLGNHAKHAWRCSDGHEWESRPSIIQQGSWCPECAGRKRSTIDDLRTWAAQHGGLCLDDECKGLASRHRWACGNGHEWMAAASEIKSGRWCPSCEGRLQRGNVEERLEKARAVALERGGRCLEEAYKGNKAPMRFACAKGHEFQKTYNKMFNQGSVAWCPQCSAEQRAFDADALARLISEKGGHAREPMPEPVQYSSIISLACAHGHAWTTEAGRILRGGQWCPVCAKSVKGPRLDIESVRAICAARGGSCLSEGFANRKSKILCACDKGHQWETTPFGLLYSESWCHECAMQTRSNSDEDKAAMLGRVKEKARSLGGSCLSTQYENCNIKLDFECGAGHTWSTTSKNILNMDSWCPECSGAYGETLAVEHARNSTGQDYKKIRPDWLDGGKGRCLEIDAFCDARQIGIEYQGEQHYQFVELWHRTQEGFEACLERDRLKRRLCANKGVLLFELRYIKRPTAERMKSHMGSEAQAMAIPAEFNPEFADFARRMDRIERMCAPRFPYFAMLAKPLAARALAEVGERA